MVKWLARYTLELRMVVLLPTGAEHKMRMFAVDDVRMRCRDYSNVSHYTLRKFCSLVFMFAFTFGICFNFSLIRSHLMVHFL